MKPLLVSVFIIISFFKIYSQPIIADQLVSSENRNSVDSSTPGGLVNSSEIPGFITFANAFWRNHAGSTGGYWSENNTDDFTFRPFFSNVSAYSLKIFNRLGYLIYESSDLHKGWDGYLRSGEPAPQGVYIWKADGRFNDGVPFNKIGDVTYLY